MSRIVEALDAWYSSQEAERERGVEDVIRPSRCGGCLREMAWLLSGAKPEPLRPAQIRTFELGSERGVTLEKALLGCFPDAELELEVWIHYGDGFSMKGHVDAWIPSTKTIVDFKTSGVFKLANLPIQGPGEDYELQLQAYRHGVALKIGLPPEEIRCFLIFESKDSDARRGIRSGMLIEHEVSWSDGLEQRFQRRLHELGILAKLLESSEGLDPELISGMPKGHWRCKADGSGNPLYCSIGPLRGRCHQES